MDSSSTYDVFAPFSINAVAASSLSSTTIPGFIANSSPLVRNVYWFVDLQTDPVFWPGGTLVVQVNGSTVYSGGISAGSSSVSWQTSGATSGSTNSSGILLDFDVS
jgi:hypothetical protein